MVKFAIFATMESKPGKADEVEILLKSALPLVEGESDTISWYALKLGENKFGIFDTFTNEDGRNAHLAGEVAKLLMDKAPELFVSGPDIQQIEVLAVKENQLIEPLIHD